MRLPETETGMGSGMCSLKQQDKITLIVRTDAPAILL